MVPKGENITLTCVLNGVSAGCIPLENFCKVKLDLGTKIVLALDSEPAEVVDAIKAMGPVGKIVPKACGAHGNRLNPGLWWGFHKRLGSSGAHIVHAHHRSSGLVSGILTRLLRPQDHFVYTLHGNLNRPGSRTYRLVQLVIMSLAHAIICNSKTTENSIPRWANFLRKRAYVIYNGVDLAGIDFIRSKHALDAPPRPFTICSVGRLVSLKQFDLLIEACAAIRDRGARDMRLIIVGDGPQRKELGLSVEKFGVSDMVTLAGSLPRNRVYSILATSDLFVMPSRSEGFCNAVVEAMAMGLPVLCSDIPVLWEVVEETAGLHFPVGDANALGDAILWFIEHPEEAAGMGRQGRRQAAERFSLESSAQQHLSLYLAISKAGQAAPKQ